MAPAINRYEVNDVFAPATLIPEIGGPVRVIDSVGLDRIIVISLCLKKRRSPYAIGRNRWIDLLDSGALERGIDPYLHLPSVPHGLPPGAESRLRTVIAATANLSQNPRILHDRALLAAEITSIANRLDMTRRSVQHWIYEWLRAGRNPVAVISKFLVIKPSRLHSRQCRGKKRGAPATKPELSSDAPVYEFEEAIDKAYRHYIRTRGMAWKSAYFEMLVSMHDISGESIGRGSFGEMLLQPSSASGRRPPSWNQFRYRCRQIARSESKTLQELPSGRRGKATDNVPGPGFFEIDATHFQIQLVSRVTKSLLVGRPSVYLIVDVYSEAITGYALTLENPSWAVAALALHNAFSDKGATFRRLGLPFDSKDWPCHHLPNVLRADRAELVSNMGQAFSTSGIRVDITESMNPRPKGSVEGKHSEVKHSHEGRFNLPGLFDKHRKRRAPDGKKGAALDLEEFERILVEIIMDLNSRAVAACRLPPDALREASQVASRIGLYAWGLCNRPGFTRTVTSNFVFEHLLTKDTGVVTTRGVKFRGELFNCDWLRDNGYLVTALNGSFEVSVAFNPLFAGELFILDTRANAWESVVNVDPELLQRRSSFAEAREYRALQAKYVEQAGLNHHVQQRQRTPEVKRAIKAAVEEKGLLPRPPHNSRQQIRINRTAEKALHRGTGLNGAMMQQDPLPAALPALPPPLTNRACAPSETTPHHAPEETSRVDSTRRFKSLWSKVHATSK